MAAKRKPFLKALNNPLGLRFGGIARLVEAFGFRVLRVNGSHHVFARDGIQEIVNAQPTRDGKAEEYQFRQFFRLVERYGLRMEG